jgi:hypothetical protein
MNDSRQLFVDHVSTVYRHSEFRVDEEHPRWDKRIRETLLDSVFYTICAYNGEWVNSSENFYVHGNL